jgi:hypothetical protein
MKRTLSLLALSALLIAACQTQKMWTATGGSRADGIVRLSFELGPLEVPVVDENQGLALAAQRCAAWGYGDAEAFGGVLQSCTMPDGYGGCNLVLVTKEYQCTGTSGR